MESSHTNHCIPLIGHGTLNVQNYTHFGLRLVAKDVTEFGGSNFETAHFDSYE